MGEMMKQTRKTIQAEIRKLRKFIDANNGTPTELHMAYLAETILRWTTEETAGWPKPLKEVQEMSRILENELRAAK